ncbi:alpha-amylase family glycosyl hydrolase [Kitasatospora purpeofusca]|uniref:alpha-amylase family glycosyl hydrolase n=1 Tax=Kitasatospora purpeofusca TaxID=67352 RepID=UPI002252BDF8|nr:alpha-amylase family glycosyl hydrolase [Kitasatospora purpeofusca]MCX4756375.1 alpha-amylase family glycosyl hydrolase [Kitasatospora purpeofusca]WSR35799.1 alpha-amylase family glycosyl hydrolase [Kitasatospora purpeofusca]
MTSTRPGPDWLTDAVLYQIYPQTFADSDGDGVGDFAGITEHLDHLAWLGVDTVWLNPCFASPFRDAGYDVTDYLAPAPRYGTADDLAALVEAAGRKGIRILLDLVAGHTSDQHPWFRASAEDPSDHRYIWSDRPVDGFVASPGSRAGWYRPNFFECQPALNFGYGREDPEQPWRQPVDAEGPRANRAALREIMAHWLGLGLAGFRVDMASSLVKDDPGFAETGKLWTELRDWLDRDHPQAALFAEWGDPAAAVAAGFHADFLLQFGGTDHGLPLRSLWNNNAGTVEEFWKQGPCYFEAEGRGTPRVFLDAWRSAAQLTEGVGHIALPTANHDFSRLATGPRTAEQLAPAFALVLTWPTLPAVYYGDEIGMRYVPDLPDVEGSVLGPTYNRAGSRTPMQWAPGPNAGFSAAPAERLYLPVDPDPHRPDVATQRADPTSLLHTVRRLIGLRRKHPGLGARGSVEVRHAGYPLVYTRAGRYLVVINPRREPAVLPLDGLLDGVGVFGRGDRAGGAGRAGGVTPLEVQGVRVDAAGELRADGFSYGVFDLG